MIPDRKRLEQDGYGRAMRPGAPRRLTAALDSLRSPPQPDPAPDGADDTRNIEEIVKQAVSYAMRRVGSNGGTPKATAFDPKLVFVITSFDDRLEPAFQAIQSAADHHDLRAERLKDAKGDFRISETILRKIDQARLIVADLTLESQNVYFELGVARGKGKTVVTIAKEGTTVHFNAQDWNTTFYDDSRTLEQELSERFRYELGAELTTEA